LDAAKDFLDTWYSVPSAGYADYAGWERGQQPQTYCGSAITVDINSDKIWISLMRLGALTGCHQMNDRSFSWKGCQFPLCARCTGLLLGQLAGFLLFVFFIKFNIIFLLCLAVVSVIPLGIDGIGQLKKLWLSTNTRRLCTGILCGYFVTVFNMNLIMAAVKMIQIKLAGA